MKIGILTYHRAHNFGALFQAIATCTLLREKGHEAYIIDYWPKYHKAMYSLFSPWAMIKRKLGALDYIKKSLKDIRSRYISKKCYDKFIGEYIMPLCTTVEHDFDVIVYGSDQIWRKQPFINSFNPVYFGKHQFPTKRHVVYAASMGIMNLTENDKETLKFLLSGLDKISVREQSLYDLLGELGVKDVSVCLDPAILMTSKHWDSIFKVTSISRVSSNYVLYVNYIKDSFDEDSIRNFANRLNLKFIKVNGSVLGKDTPDAITTSGPLELLNLIRNASYVFSSSFHAMIFSIVYHRQFYAAFSKNSDRASSILNYLGLGNRLVDKNYDKFSIIPISYDDIDEKINLLRQSSLDYLYKL